MSKRSVVLAVVLGAAAAVTASAQGPGMGMVPGGPGAKGMAGAGGMHRGPDRLLPPGTWWRDQSTVTAIGLSADQQKKIDGIFLEARVQLIHMHATLEENQLRMDDTLSAPTLDAAKAQKEIDEAADTRAALEKAEAHMLLTIRGVLSNDQWTKLQGLRRHDMGPAHVMGPDHSMGKRGMRRDGPQDNGMPHPPAPGQRPDGPPAPPQEEQQ